MRGRSLWAMGLLLLAAPLGAAAEDEAAVPTAPSAVERLVNLGTHRLQVRIEGRGAPTIVIEAGLTDGIEKLRPLQARLAERTCVLTYNRAGYGESEAGPLPRDAGREAAELRALLAAVGLPGPHLLVGHSLGALNALVFAASSPDEIAGLVLLDPPPFGFLAGEDFADLAAMAEAMTAEWQAIADANADAVDPEGRARSRFFGAIASEHRELFAASAQLAGALPPELDVPLVVIAAGRANPAFGEEAAAFQGYWIEQSRALAARSTQGRFILAKTASHDLYLDAPELVAASILTLLNAAQGR